MARGERVIAISEYVAEHVRERYQVPPERLRLIPRGVDIAAVRSRSGVRGAAQRCWPSAGA